MNVKKFNNELRALSKEQLAKKHEQSRREFFTLRLNTQTSHVKNQAQFGFLKKNIARILTVMREKERSI